MIKVEEPVPACSLNDEVTISLSKAECLILFELLTTSYEVWRTNNPDDSSALPMVVNAESYSQRLALWRLEGSLERTPPELFSSKYGQLLIEANGLLSAPKD